MGHTLVGMLSPAACAGNFGTLLRFIAFSIVEGLQQDLTRSAGFGLPTSTSRYKFVSWFAEWICSIQSWGKGSKQRDAALRTGSEYNHLYNCRRLGEAEAYVNASLTQGLAECQEWDVGTFGSGFSYDDIVELKTCVRASYVLADKRHAYLSRLPT